MRGNKKNPKVNGHISTANKRIPEIFFLQPPQYYHVFFEHIFYTRLHPQAKIFKHFHARMISKMVKCTPDLENPNITMITIEPPSQIWSIESSYAIPFFFKKILENGFLEKKLFQNYNFLYLTKNHLFFLKFSKKFKFTVFFP